MELCSDFVNILNILNILNTLQPENVSTDCTDSVQQKLTFAKTFIKHFCKRALCIKIIIKSVLNLTPQVKFRTRTSEIEFCYQQLKRYKET